MPMIPNRPRRPIKFQIRSMLASRWLQCLQAVERGGVCSHQLGAPVNWDIKSFDRRGVIAVFRMVLAHPEQAQQSDQSEQVPDQVTSALLAGEPFLGFGANTAASILGNRWTAQDGRQTQNKNNACSH